MGIYRIVPDSDNFGRLEYVNPAHRIALTQARSHRIANTWHSFSVKFEAQERLGCFPSLPGGVLTCSEETLQVLLPLIGDSIEALPIQSNLGTYFILHVVDVADCLDYSRAEVKRFSSSRRVMKIVSYAFKKDCIGNRNIFVLPESSTTILVSESFKRFVEENALEGLLFKQVT